MNILSGFKNISTFIFDMDGVLTDGTILVFSGEQQLRRMNVKDGLALQMALRNGYRVVILSGSKAEAAKERLQLLGLTEIHMSVVDKMKFVSDYISTNRLSWEELLYMGDDLPDVDLLKAVGLSTCPSDAVQEVRNSVQYISPLAGGMGCVRDVIEKVLKLNDHWVYEHDIVSK